MASNNTVTLWVTVTTPTMIRAVWVKTAVQFAVAIYQFEEGHVYLTPNE